MPAEARRIALFGGTFDPIHSGHLDIAAKARAHCRLHEIMFIPCCRSPLKEKSPTADDAARLAMLRLATAELPWASVNLIELDAPPPSYTWKTVDALRAQHPPDTRFHLLIGLDQWENFHRWARASHLAEHVHFIVAGRDGQATPRPGRVATFIQGEHPASASAIRAALAKGRTPKWLPEKVARHIKQNHLYPPQSH